MQMTLCLLAAAGVVAAASSAGRADGVVAPPPLSATPPQNQGLPYTRTALSMAIAKIKGCTVVFPGSRYAYVAGGYRVRLDDVKWHDEAMLRNGAVYVPRGFVGVLAEKKIDPDTPPSFLTDRWVYTVNRGPVPVLPGVQTMDIGDGDVYMDVAGAARALGLGVFVHPRGLVLIGNPPPTLADVPKPLVDSIVALFDTPEKFADPDIATKYIPTLERQGKWTDYVKVTPKQVASLNGPETEWIATSEADYDYSGINTSLFGSKVPPPGVYPRVLFSPGDVPGIAKRIASSKAGQMSLIEMDYLFKHSWWDASTSDGQIFRKLSTGRVADLTFDVTPDTPPMSYPAQFKGEQTGITNSHVSYVPECLTTMALYCLLTNDDIHGKQAADAIVNYYKLREPLLDETNAISDSEFGGTYTRPDGTVITMDGNGASTHWRTTEGVIGHMNLGLALDFGGKWMTADQKETMCRVIAKATYGRRAYGQDGPIRFRDVNWVTWDLTNLLAVTAIEGLPGFDREAYESNSDTARAFCDYGIDSSGVIYESNGKAIGGLQFQLLAMVTLARRGLDLFGHPHFRKLMQGQVQMTSPTGKVIVVSGTQYVPFSRSTLSASFVDEFKDFYPKDLTSDYLISQEANGDPNDESVRQWIFNGFDPTTFAKKVPTLKRLRLPSPTYPAGFVHGVLYDTDYVPTSRADLNLPLDFNAPVHGVFSSYSDSSESATWVNMMVRPDHYLGAGHHHADAGMLHFSAGGVDWFTQSPFDQTYDGKYYSVPLIDGHSEPENMPGIANGYQAAATYLGAKISGGGSFATADLTNSYTYRWLTQPPHVWTADPKLMNWEMDPSPAIQKMYAGTARYKMRPWWASPTYSNFIATSRALFNPMTYVYRSVGLVRGPHPYGVVVDDLRKDDQTHVYQWAAMLNGGVWQAQSHGLPTGEALLAFRPQPPNDPPATFGAKYPIAPEVGEPLLLVATLGNDSGNRANPSIQVTTEAGVPDKNGLPQPYDRLAINCTSTQANFKVLLVPVHAPDTLPLITYDAATLKAKVTWSDGQQDEITFTSGTDHRSHVSVQRAGKLIAESL